MKSFSTEDERPGGQLKIFKVVQGLMALVSPAAAIYAFAAIMACWFAMIAGPIASAQASSQIPDLTITASFPSGEPTPPAITSKAAILIDQDTGEILFSHNANARLPMASTTKIMTAMVVLENMNLNTEVTVSANAVSTAGSKSRLQQGEVLTVEQLLYAMLVVSGNDAGVALAEATAGSTAAFVEMMNSKAEELGLTNTHFVNTCGLNHEKHFSSAKDLATLAQYALQDPVFRQIVNTVYFSLPPLGEATSANTENDENLRDFDNQNELLHRLEWVTGVKTGSTPYAKYCLVASGTIEGVSLIAVILGAQEDDVRWNEAKSLLEYGFSLYPRTLLVDTGELVGKLDVGDYLGRKVRLVAAGPVVVRLSRTDVVTGTLRLDRALSTPVQVGDVFGALDFTVDGDTVGSVEVIASQSVARPPTDMITGKWAYLWPRGLKWNTQYSGW